MTRIAYDSTDPSNIPPTAEVVMYYPHAWGTDLQTHGGALQVRIDNRGDHADDCHVLDVEAGAATPEIAAEWVASWHKLHPNGLAAVNGHFAKPTIYCSLSPWESVKSAVGDHAVDWWIAEWTGKEHAIPGAVACQYAGSANTGHNYDMSVITDDSWGKAAIPTPPPPAVSTRGRLIPLDHNGMVAWGLSEEVESSDGGHNWKAPAGGSTIAMGFAGGILIPYSGTGSIELAQAHEVWSSDHGATFH